MSKQGFESEKIERFRGTLGEFLNAILGAKYASPVEVKITESSRQHGQAPDSHSFSSEDELFIEWSMNEDPSTVGGVRPKYRVRPAKKDCVECNNSGYVPEFDSNTGPSKEMKRCPSCSSGK